MSKMPMKFGISKKKASDFSDWYTQVVTKSDLISTYSIRGFTIMRPSSTFIWRQIQDYINTRIAEEGVEEVYFPMIIPKEQLEKEKSHIDNFEPEVAWITKSGKNDIEHLAVRPTSETIMYPYFSKWIRSHRDLPLKVNQWCNILRWEVKSTVPFIRGREFLWQEGHSAHETKEGCDEEVRKVLDMYSDVYKDLLAVHVISGRKTENEKFGGADYTLSVEAFIKESGRAVQAATSHCLGTNFARMFDIKADDYVYQSSWGLTTRSIGVAVMIHSDDSGCVLPPKVANIQAVIIPCGKMDEKVVDYINEIELGLKNNKIRVRKDLRENVTPGYKFNYYEIKGIPIRIEVGPRDVENESLVLVMRHTLKKKIIKKENFVREIQNQIEIMHNEMYEKARKDFYSSVVKVNDWETFMKEINNNNMILFSWCNTSICEEIIKEESQIKNKEGDIVTMGAKSLCIPFEYNVEVVKGTCFKCNKEAVCNVLFGRSY